MTMPETILRAENVTLGYGDHVVVDAVDLDVAVGELVYVVGRNGSGKSTLLKGLLGLLPLRSGRVDLASGLDGAAFMPQAGAADPDFPATVMEIALSGRQTVRKLFPFYSRGDREAARRALADLGIADLAKRRFGELSGGQRQRAYLARALCRDPRLLLLDEPYSGLDASSSRALERLLAGLRSDRGMTVIMTTHDILSTGDAGCRVVELDGKVIYDGPGGDWPGRMVAEGR